MIPEFQASVNGCGDRACACRILSELNGFRCGGEGGEGGDGAAEIQHLSVAVVLVVHSAEIGIGVEHRLLRFKAVVLELVHRVEGAHTRLIALYSCKIINLCFFRKSSTLFIGVLLIFLLLSYVL